MVRVAVLLAPGFEEIEAVTVIDVLRRADITVVALGVAGSQVTGSHGIALRADRLLRDAVDDPWDMVVLPGGLPGANHLRDDPAVQGLIARQHERGGRLAAICAAPIALGRAGVLAGRAATSYPGFERELQGAHCRSDRVVVDGTVTTSRGPGTALEFALVLVETLRNREVAAQLASAMLVAAPPTA